MSPPTRKRHLPTLDGWRALAVLLVLTCHAFSGVWSRGDYFASALPRYGTLGVDIFFGLSGLLISKLLLEEATRSGSINLASFYIRRFCRIVLTCAAFATILGLLGLIRNGWEFASCLLFFRNYLPVHLGGHYTAQLWSLAVEEHFYMILPGFLLFWGWKRAPYMAALFALGCAAWRMVEIRLDLLSYVLPGVQLGARTDLRFDSFLWGCVVAFAAHRPESALWLRRHYRAWMWPVFAGLLLACVQFQPHMTPTWTAMLIPVVLVGPMLHPEWLAGRFLDLAPVRYLGRISFSMYLWQQVFLVPTWEAPSRLLAPWQRLPGNLLAIAVVSIGSFYLIERPLTNLGHRLSARTRNRVADAGTPAMAGAAALQ